MSDKNNFLKSNKIVLDKKQIKREKKLSAADFIYDHHDFLNAKAKVEDTKEFVKTGAKKSVRGIKTTGKAVHDGIVTTRVQGAEAIARYTPDIYDKHDDVATGSLKTLSGLGVQGSRAALRTKRSVQNSFHNQKITSLNNQENKILLQIKELKVRQESGENVNAEIQELKNQLTAIKQKRISQASKINKGKGLQLGVSFKRSASNQFRKGISSIAVKEDMGSKVIGSSIQSVYYVNRYKRSIKTVARVVTSVVSGIISAIMGIITSIPAIVAALVSILPILLIAIAIIAVLLNFIDLTVSGRVSVLADNVYTLNELYDVNIEPEYVLAISQELGWTSGDIKDYERLYSFMIGQKKKGITPSFDQMINNVFEKYNPLNSYLKNGIYSRDDYTAYVFYSNSGFNVIGTNTQKIKVGEFIDLYPKYRDNYEESKKNFNINDIRKRCHDSLAYNQQMYLKYMSTLSGFCAGKSETGNAIAQKALSVQGCLYYWGGSGEVKNSTTFPPKRDKVFDCSGLVYWAHTQEGVEMGRSTANMYGKMGKAVKKNELQAGDVITFDWDKNGVDDHIVIYIGNGKVVGAEGKGSGTYANDIEQCVKIWELAKKNKYISKMRRLY